MLAGLSPSHVTALREAAVTVTYEGTYSSTRPVLRGDGSLCFNPGDGCTVARNASEAGHAALDALAAALAVGVVDSNSTSLLRIIGATGMAFVVDNSRVLHGRLGQVVGRRRVVGGEAPASAVAERWAELAAVEGCRQC